METCPHCQFLVRDGARTCDVCKKALVDNAGIPSFAGGQRRHDDIVAARVGPSEVGSSNAVVWLFVVAVLMGAAVWASTNYWI